MIGAWPELVQLKKKDELEEALVFGDVDVKEISVEDGKAEVVIEPSDLEKATNILKDLGVSEFDVNEVTWLANDKVTLEEDDLRKFKELLEQLDDCEDVQNVYHNVQL